MDRRPPGAPFRAFRDRYVAPFAGLSYDLAPRTVGVHPQHLAEVPELADRDVLVTHDTSRPMPLHKRPAFRVLELNTMMRDALGHAAQGVVFSIFDLDDPEAATLLDPLRVGASLFLNSALHRLPGDVVRRPDVAS